VEIAGSNHELEELNWKKLQYILKYKRSDLTYRQENSRKLLSKTAAL
jgi:hypothetical protein